MSDTPPCPPAPLKGGRGGRGVHNGLYGLCIDGGADEELVGAVAQLRRELGHEAVSCEEGAFRFGTVQQTLALVVELPLSHGHGLEATEVVLIAHLRLAGVAVERCPHIEGVGHGHNLVDDHGVPVLAHDKTM